MRTPSAVNSLIDDLFERKYRKVGQEKKRITFFFSSCFLLQYPDAGSKYREFYDLSDCRVVSHVWFYVIMRCESK